MLVILIGTWDIPVNKTKTVIKLYVEISFGFGDPSCDLIYLLAVLAVIVLG